MKEWASRDPCRNTALASRPKPQTPRPCREVTCAAPRPTKSQSLGKDRWIHRASLPLKNVQMIAALNLRKRLTAAAAHQAGEAREKPPGDRGRLLFAFAASLSDRSLPMFLRLKPKPSRVTLSGGAMSRLSLMRNVRFEPRHPSGRRAVKTIFRHQGSCGGLPLPLPCLTKQHGLRLGSGLFKMAPG